MVRVFENPVITVEIPWEPLTPGPVGARVEVIDYDPAVGEYYAPVDLNDRNVLAQDGLPPSEADPRFHQQMTYAVVMATHERFERALGRTVGLRRGSKRLRIYPHGTREPNAFFSPEHGALIFGYFNASKSSWGRNLPGGAVFTCLSHDIVAHEATHGILHGLRHRFLEPTSRDVLAFHEAFADLVAILQRFSLPGFLENAIQETHGELDEVTPLFEMGRQFGEAIGRRGALRAAIGEEADPAALSRIFEPHDRGAILVAAVFDALVAVYQHRTQDLLRIASGGTGIVPPGHLAPDLAGRLAREARRTAKHFLDICIRAIDYCPPLDIDFGDYLRALITADRDVVPDDPEGYRSALIAAFRARGIFPREVFSLAEDSLVWRPPEEVPDTSGIGFERIRFDKAPQTVPKERRPAYYQLFHSFVTKRKNMKLFGLSTDHKVQIASVQPLRRIAPNGRITNEVVVQAIQRGDKVLKDAGAPFFLGGCTLIVREGEPGGNGCSVRYCVHKRLRSTDRKERQGAFLEELKSFQLGREAGGMLRLPTFQQIHRGWWQ